MTALPNDAEIVPKPVSKPGIQNPAGKPVIQKPVAKPVIQKPVEKPVIKRADVDSKAAGSPRANGQNLGNKKLSRGRPAAVRQLICLPEGYNL